MKPCLSRSRSSSSEQFQQSAYTLSTSLWMLGVTTGGNQEQPSVLRDVPHYHFDPVGLPIVPTIVSMALSRPPALTRTFNIQSMLTATTFASSLPLILDSSVVPFHVGFTKDVADFREYVLKQGGTTGFSNQGASKGRGIFRISVWITELVRKGIIQRR